MNEKVNNIIKKLRIAYGTPRKIKYLYTTENEDKMLKNIKMYFRGKDIKLNQSEVVMLCINYFYESELKSD